MTARKNTKKNLQPRFARRPLPSLTPEKELPVHPLVARTHENAMKMVKLIRAGHTGAAANFVKKIEDPGQLRTYIVAFAAIAAGKPMPHIEVNDITPQTPEDGADSDGETR